VTNGIFSPLRSRSPRRLVHRDPERTPRPKRPKVFIPRSGVCAAELEGRDVYSVQAPVMERAVCVCVCGCAPYGDARSVESILYRVGNNHACNGYPRATLSDPCASIGIAPRAGFSGGGNPWQRSLGGGLVKGRRGAGGRSMRGWEDGRMGGSPGTGSDGSDGSDASLCRPGCMVARCAARSLGLALDRETAAEAGDGAGDSPGRIGGCLV
jgi:hypothetical protein